jgi:dihydrofolate synthase/folylpolyglutamate synthase
VLIAGTNGKGATAAIVHSVLVEAGFRVGLYTSPHLVSFTERIRIGRAELACDRVTRGVVRLAALTESTGVPLTFFEMATVLAFDEFADANVDVAVLEVGLGGRLDATNVVDAVASAVVSIGYDHQEFLGATLGEIAREKAGVMRPGRPIALGPGLPVEARTVLLDEATRVGARVVEAETCSRDTAALALRGHHMRGNAAVALALLDELGRAVPGLRAGANAIEAGLGAVRWPGRLDVVQRCPLVVVDGAHNREGVAALLRALPDVIGASRPRLLFAALADKPWREMAADLAPYVGEVTVTQVGGARGVAAELLATAFSGSVPIEPDPARALAQLLARDDRTPLLVAGSLYLVGAVYEAMLARHGTKSVFDPLPEQSL